MKYSASIFLFLFLPIISWAHQPMMVLVDDPADYIAIENPTVSFAYYGELTGFPHTYQIVIDEPITLYAQVLEPDIDGAMKNHSGIIVQEVDRGVQEIARLPHDDADWHSEYEPFGGDSYLNGAEFSGEIEAGTYLIEVSNGDNLGKYVLVVGTEEDFSESGYFQTLGGIYEVKRFFEKPAIAVLQSPFYYLPVGVFLIIIGGVYWYRRRQKNYA